MHDILPADMDGWRRLESSAEQIFTSYGFEEIRVPLLEKTEVFSRAIGNATDVVEKQMYSFEDRGGKSLSLRPEGTAGVVRAVLQNGLLYGSPLRLWYRGPMFRHERPQQGRTRQFNQIGTEVFGAEGPDIDAELIIMAERLWRQLGLDGLRLEINSLGNSAERSAYREKLVRFLASNRDELDAKTRQRVDRNPLRVLDSKEDRIQSLLENAPRLWAFLGAASRRHFDDLRAVLDRLCVDYEVNPRLVRGLDYYSHTVFEWISSDLGAQSTVCGGGRYDKLVELQGGKPWPGIGFAMGQERLVELISRRAGTPKAAPNIYMVLSGRQAKISGMELAEKLRDEVKGLSIVCNTGDGSFKSQFKRADRSGAALALVMGEDEVKSTSVTIKPLREDRPQEKLQLSDLVNWMNNWVGRQ